MDIFKISLLTCSISILLTSATSTPSFCQESYVDQMFTVRNNIINHEKSMTLDMKASSGTERRLLETVFELNNSTLTMIEAYFRILKIAIATESQSKPEIVEILNEWLSFMSTQCQNDLRYLQNISSRTTDGNVIKHVNASKNNIEILSKIVYNGIVDNRNRMYADKEKEAVPSDQNSPAI